MDVQAARYQLNGPLAIPCPEGFNMIVGTNKVTIEGNAPDTDTHRNRFIRVEFNLDESDGVAYLRQRYVTVYQEYERCQLKWEPTVPNGRWPGKWVPTGKWKKNKPKDVVKRADTTLMWLLNGLK